MASHARYGIAKGVLIAAASSTLFLVGHPTAAATPGQVDGSPGIEDYDGTQGDYRPSTVGTIDSDGTNGDSYGATTVPTDPHVVQSDACYITNSGCLPDDSYGPTTIQAGSGVKDGPASSLDPDGFQGR